MNDRGQAHSLEGISAALLVLLSLLFAVQVSVTGPLASNTAQESIADQLRGAGEGTLAVANERGYLREAALNWSAENNTFGGNGPNGAYIDRSDPTDFTRLLDDSFPDPRTTYNALVVYRQDGTRGAKQLVYSGEPPDGAVTVSRMVTLYDDNRLANGDRLDDLSGAFYANDTSSGNVYAVLRVEVTVWRT